MAEINFRDEQLEKWFKEAYEEASSATPENHNAYQSAPDKDAFKHKAIAEERKRRLISYMDTQNREHGQTNLSAEEALDNYVRNNPQVSEEQVVSEVTKNIISRHDAESGRQRSAFSDQNAFLVDSLKIETLHDMKIVSDEEAKDLTPQKAIEILNNTLPKLNDNQLKEMETRLTDKMLDNDAVFNLIPPSILAKKYDELSATIEATANNQQQQQAHNKALRQKGKVAERIDQLTDMLVNNEHKNSDLYFADPTNIADIHQGYTAMFDARAKDLQKTQQNNNTSPRLNQITRAQNLLDEALKGYEQVYSLTEIKPNDASALDSRFDKLVGKLDKTKLSEETLTLVSNFKFLDDAGKPKPQFIGKGGKKSDVYTPGAKIIKGSELDTALQLAKQKTTLATLGTKDELKPEFLQQQLSDNLTGTLYSLHITDQVYNGLLEKPDQFTNRQHLEKFKQDLANPQRKMSISPKAFDAGVDQIVNETNGYATALNNKLKKDKDSPTSSVVLKLFDPLAKIDKRAQDRTQSDANKTKFRAEMRKRLLKSGVSAFTVSAGITLLSAGTNKVVGAAAGLGLGVALTGYQLVKHYKQCKKEGKSFKLNRNLALTLGTTALSGFAIGAMATGNPEMAMVAGLGALALGTTNGGIQIAKQAKEAHISKKEAAAWIVGQAAVNIGAAFTGRLAGGAIVDAVNTHTDSHIFKHEVSSEEVVTEKTQKFGDGTHEASQQTLKTIYTDEHNHFHETELQAKIDDNLKFIDEHRQIFEDRGFQLDDPTQKLALAEKMELTKIALGENTGIDNVQHVDGGGVHHSHGNHYTMTDKVLAENGFRDPSQAKSDFMDMFNSNDPDAINKGLDSFEKINTDILGKHNEINYSDTQTMQNSHHDGVLHRDAVLGDDGKLHVDWKNGTEYNTYVEGSGTLQSQIHETVNTTTEYVPNEVHDGYGMFGVLGNIFGRKRKEPAYALADRVRKKIPNPNPPRPQPQPQPVIPQELQKYVVFEYQVLRGKNPQTTDVANDPKKHQEHQDWLAYCAQVEKERKMAEEDKKAPVSMKDFLEQRNRKFAANLSLLKKKLNQSSRRTPEETAEKNKQRKAMIEDFPKHPGKPQDTLFCQGLYDSIARSNLSYNPNIIPGSKTPFDSFEQVTHYAGEFARDSWFVGRATRHIGIMNDKEKDSLKRRIPTTGRILVGSLKEFYSEDLTAEGYEEKASQCINRKRKNQQGSWWIPAKKAWDTLATIARSVQKGPQRQQQNQNG